jgi:beta-mannosidase
VGRRELNEGWTVVATAGPVPEPLAGRKVDATVPGCVSTDLLAAGFLPDPYVGTNEAEHAWVGRTAWRYEVTFGSTEPGPGERLDLVFEGLDTCATLKLNQTVIGTVANMHRSYRFDVGGVLRAGTNVLAVDFEPPLDAAERRSEELGPRPHVNAHPFNAVRKMACNFGWDWGPDVATVGIWRPVYLERWRLARVASVRPLVRVALRGGVDAVAPASGIAKPGPGPVAADASRPTSAAAEVEFRVELERAESGVPLRVRAEVAGEQTVAEVPPNAESAVVRVRVPEAELWWPAGYGPQPLYEASVTLEQTGGGVVGAWRNRLGFRSVELDTGPDERGARLAFVVNGRCVQVRGANWIPDDCFPSRISPDRYQERLLAARGANCNLLRVWGGGIYEHFYEAADELGLLVWQDFCLACAAYAEEEPLRGEIEAEAREAVTRLSTHPSLAVWSGGNENIVGHEDWGWKEALGAKSWGAGYYFKLFPEVLAELDPTRPYMAGSPWSFGHDAHPNDPRFGTVHVWDVWNQKD